MENTEKILLELDFAVDRATWYMEIKKAKGDIEQQMSVWEKSKTEAFQQEEALHDKNKFNRLLLKTPLENHTEDLWKLGIGVILALRERGISKTEETASNAHLVELTETLLFLMENEGQDIRLKISTPKTYLNASNQSTIVLIKNCLYSKFKDYGLNQIPMTEETARYLLETGQADDWINTYYDVSKDDEDGNPYPVHATVDDEMVAFFREGRSELVDNVDIEFLKTTLKNLEEQSGNRKQRGRPVITYHIIYILQQVMPLLHHETTNGNFRLIFDCCDFFKFIPAEVTSDYQYIKSIYRNSKGVSMPGRLLL